jgi:hypothetical protein
MNERLWMMFAIPHDVNPQIYILWLLRSGRVNDWDSLAREFGLDPEFAGTASLILSNYLDSLQSAGLIIVERQPNGGSYGVPRGSVRLSEQWAKIQTALDLSLTELTKLNRSAMIITPYFGKPERVADTADLFVLMPFDPQLRRVHLCDGCELVLIPGHIG